MLPVYLPRLKAPATTANFWLILRSIDVGDLLRDNRERVRARLFARPAARRSCATLPVAKS